jgi:hypothetical protein
VSTQTILLILVAAIVIILVALAISSSVVKRRSEQLREKFGPEYDYTMQKEGDKQAAEEALKERERRVTNLDIRSLNPGERDRYQAEWKQIQADFVDTPAKSVEEANRLISEVMVARGFPVADFEQRAADLSVMYPDFVSNYRNAYAIATKNQNNGASTEELRQSMVYYRSMFDELLGTMNVKNNVKEVATR